MNESKASRAWCFTLNNWTEEEYEALKKYKCDYIVIGKEIGAEGTPHLQGYIEFSGGKRFSTLKKAFPKVHWEPRKSTAEKAAAYCKKDGIFIEIGEKKTQGHRTDLDEAVVILQSGGTLKDVAEALPKTYIKNTKGLTLYAAEITEHRTTKPYVEWRYGDTGLGKTYYCVNKHKSHYIKDGSKWWDGYNHQEAIIIDDFNNNFDTKDLLRLLDKYGYQGEIKGGYVKITSPYIYITCDRPPEEFWAEKDLAQILRRIDKIVHLIKNTSLAMNIKETLRVTEVSGNTISDTSSLASGSDNHK